MLFLGLNFCYFLPDLFESYHCMREYSPPSQTIQVVLVILSKVSWIRLEPLNVIVWLNYKVHISYIMLNLLQIFISVLKELNLK